MSARASAALRGEVDPQLGRLISVSCFSAQRYLFAAWALMCECAEMGFHCCVFWGWIAHHVNWVMGRAPLVYYWCWEVLEMGKIRVIKWYQWVAEMVCIGGSWCLKWFQWGAEKVGSVFTRWCPGGTRVRRDASGILP